MNEEFIVEIEMQFYLFKKLLPQFINRHTTTHKLFRLL